MRFCMVTTFFGRESFGGDAAYVDRLSRALARRGHNVDVIHCADSFRAVQPGYPPRSYEPSPDVRVHTLESRLGALSPLWTHQTGNPGPKSGEIRRILAEGEFDVVHFHNISLVGGPGVLDVAATALPSAVRLMTAHEYWLACPMHFLWKLDRQLCDRPQCIRCSIAGRRPPQLWRSRNLAEKSLERLDALICPSRTSLGVHQRFQDRVQLVRLAHFLPDDWAGSQELPGRGARRPYVVGAGRLVHAKGFQNVIASIAQVPWLDLLVAGAGPYEDELRRAARGLPNVRFLGLLDAPRLAQVLRDARAVVVPTLYLEPFGYIVLEAASVGTPSIVHDRGALTELVEESGGGIVYRTPVELEAALRAVGRDDELRDALGDRALEGLSSLWSEETHMDRYLDLVDELRGATRRPDHAT